MLSKVVVDSSRARAVRMTRWHRGHTSSHRPRLPMRASVYRRPPHCACREHPTMGAKHFGARVARLEDPALLTGAAASSTTSGFPARSKPASCAARTARPHPRDRYQRRHAPCRVCMRCSPPTTCPRAWRAARSRCWCPIRRSRAAHPARAGAARGLLRRPDHRGGDCGQPLSRRGRRRRGGDRVRGLAGGERLPRCRQARRAARAQRSRQQHRRRSCR